MPTFAPPTVNDLPTILPATRGVQYRLWRHYGGNPAGVSVVKVNGVYTTIRTPTTVQLEAAGNREGIDFFLGGHVYTVTDAVSAALIADGYTTGVDPVVPGRQLTWGFVGGLTWNEFTNNYGTWG
jgi:hypothetical protein